MLSLNNIEFNNALQSFTSHTVATAEEFTQRHGGSTDKDDHPPHTLTRCHRGRSEAADPQNTQTTQKRGPQITEMAGQRCPSSFVAFLLTPAAGTQDAAPNAERDTRRRRVQPVKR
jgi:hypothetical protein